MDAMDAAKTAFSVMGACAFALTFVPHPLRSKLDGCIRDLWEKLFSQADPFSYIEVYRKGRGMIPSSIRAGQNPEAYVRSASISNPFYAEVGLYLGSLNIEFATRRVCVYGMDLADEQDRPLSGASKFAFGLPLNETLTDTFEGAQFSWTHTAAPSDGKQTSSRDQDDENADRVFTLKLLKSDKHRILHPYLNHISSVACDIRKRNTLPTLYTNGRHGAHWTPVTLKHPSTFDTIALDGNMAERIQADLNAFLESEAYYHSIGRAWKRGYLLYGPPGTGKSSLIAAIANYMHYDIYDLELTNVYDNTTLQNLLMQTTRKSIIVIEDIDCSMSQKISERRQVFDQGFDEGSEFSDEAPDNHSRGFTLSGLLNFADGLLSCFGEERIFIFTTNHKERLDSALLRCGRMDMHIHLSYCTFTVLKKLAANYLQIKSHSLFEELEEAMKLGVKITPASIAEVLIGGRKNPDEAIKQVLAAVKRAEPLDTADKEQGMADATQVAKPSMKKRKGQRRKFPPGLTRGTHGEGAARSKRRAIAHGHAGDPSAAKATGLWAPEEEFEEPSRDVQAPTTVEERMVDGRNALCQKFQNKEFRQSPHDGLEKFAGDNPWEMVTTNNASGTPDVGNGSLSQVMRIDDSEGSSDEGSTELAMAPLNLQVVSDATTDVNAM